MTLPYKVEERTIERTEAYSADEAFLCGSTTGITLVLSIDRYRIGYKIGEITKEIKTKVF